MSRIEAALNCALKTADTKSICAAIDTIVRRSPNVSQLAKEAGISRSMLYRSLRGKKGPTLVTILRILRSVGFQLVVKFERQPKKDKPNPFGQSSKTTAHLELRGDSKASAKFLTRAFENDDLIEITKALEDTLRAQENVVEFAKRTSMRRSALYRAFSGSHVPQFSTIIHFLHALGLHLAVVPLAKDGS